MLVNEEEKRKILKEHVYVIKKGESVEEVKKLNQLVNEGLMCKLIIMGRFVYVITEKGYAFLGEKPSPINFRELMTKLRSTEIMLLLEIYRRGAVTYTRYARIVGSWSMHQLYKLRDLGLVNFVKREKLRIIYLTPTGIAFCKSLRAILP